MPTNLLRPTVGLIPKWDPGITNFSGIENSISGLQSLSGMTENDKNEKLKLTARNYKLFLCTVDDQQMSSFMQCLTVLSSSVPVHITSHQLVTAIYCGNVCEVSRTPCKCMHRQKRDLGLRSILCTTSDKVKYFLLIFGIQVQRALSNEVHNHQPLARLSQASKTLEDHYVNSGSRQLLCQQACGPSTRERMIILCTSTHVSSILTDLQSLLLSFILVYAYSGAVVDFQQKTLQ